ncbi:hypothetical protein LX36DRAFT_15292 [Colletotrichum falcatum]|nr:hypothetical protein LX36DRAFT_15292 [Colletotrichum falcatum]
MHASRPRPVCCCRLPPSLALPSRPPSVAKDEADGCGGRRLTFLHILPPFTSTKYGVPMQLKTTDPPRQEGHEGELTDVSALHADRPRRQATLQARKRGSATAVSPRTYSRVVWPRVVRCIPHSRLTLSPPLRPRIDSECVICRLPAPRLLESLPTRTDRQASAWWTVELAPCRRNTPEHEL